MDFTKYKGCTIGITYDDNGAFDPREETNLGTMVCYHKRYRLGDENSVPFEAFNSWEEVEDYLRKSFNPAVILPLYVYDHSCLTMHTVLHGQYAWWDGGQVGYIYVTKETLRDWYGVKQVRQTLIDRATKVLLNEVEEYSCYLNGEAYQYYIWAPWVEVDEDDPDLDSALDYQTGILGEKNALDYAKEFILGDIQTRKEA